MIASSSRLGAGQLARPPFGGAGGSSRRRLPNLSTGDAEAIFTAIPNGTNVWMAVPASPPLRLTIRDRLKTQREECRCRYIPASQRQGGCCLCARAISNCDTTRIDLPVPKARHACCNGDYPKNCPNMAGISASRSVELCAMSFSRLRCSSMLARSRPRRRGTWRDTRTCNVRPVAVPSRAICSDHTAQGHSDRSAWLAMDRCTATRR